MCRCTRVDAITAAPPAWAAASSAGCACRNPTVPSDLPPALPSIPQHPLVAGLRRSMVPRLRKYLLHPRKTVRVLAATHCMGLGCLSKDMVDQVATCEPTSIQVGSDSLP